MIRAAWDQAFKRSYKKRVRNNSRLKKKFWEKMKIFLENPFFPQLRTHKLSGKLADNGHSVSMMIVGSFLSSLMKIKFS